MAEVQQPAALDGRHGPEAMAIQEERFPINCVEGWSAGAQWRGLRLLDVVTRAGGSADSRVSVVSLERKGTFNHRRTHVVGVCAASRAGPPGRATERRERYAR